VYAELDSTNLLYRADNLIPATGPDKSAKAIIDDAKKVIEREKEFASGRDLQDAWKATDQSCEGGVNSPAQSWLGLLVQSIMHQTVQFCPHT